MIDINSGAVVQWDYQIGTFTGQLGALRVGLFGGDIATVAELQARLGVTLSAETGAELQESYLAAPYTANKRFVSKLQFMDLFRPADLTKIYAMARNTDPAYLALSVAVSIELDRVNRAPKDQIELSDPRVVAGLAKMEQYTLISAGDATRIAQGLPWQP